MALKNPSLKEWMWKLCTSPVEFNCYVMAHVGAKEGKSAGKRKLLQYRREVCRKERNYAGKKESSTV
jgi:hypothetical protein